jgi:hypothetical protein
MATPTDGGPAFPRLTRLQDRGVGGREYGAEVAGGMSLRDYFAGQVIGALMSNIEIQRQIDAHRQTAKMDSYDINAGMAYAAADAMLKARSHE